MNGKAYGEMKRVLFVIETLRGGGAERALSNIVTHFPMDWHIDILVNDKSLIEYPFRGNILSLFSPEKISRLYFIKNVIKRTLYLMKVKKRNGYDACVSFLEGPNISNIVSGNKYCKTVVSIRSQIMDEHAGILSRIIDFFLVKGVFCYADRIVPVSKEIALELVYKLKIPKNKVEAIVNGYDCEWIRDRMTQQPQRTYGRDFISSTCKVVVTVGRLVELKGQWHLIRAFSEVVKVVPQAVLFIVGDGMLKSYLLEVIHMYGLEDRVFLIGHSDNPFWFYANADIFVLSSLWEGYPNALAEAVCCGTPCLATDVHSGPREILAPDLDAMGKRVSKRSEERYGILVPACSGKMYRNCETLEAEEHELAEAMIFFLNDSEKRKYYQKKSIERSKELDIRTTVDKWINIISDNTYY